MEETQTTNTKSTKPAKKPAKTETADTRHGRGQGRDASSMLTRMKGRLATEVERLRNTADRATKAQDKAGAKKALGLANALNGVVNKFD